MPIGPWTLDMSHGQPDHGRAMTDEIIGREGELSAVQAFLDRPVDGMRALVIEGEPGIGKSTLWPPASSSLGPWNRAAAGPGQKNSKRRFAGGSCPRFGLVAPSRSCRRSIGPRVRLRDPYITQWSIDSKSGALNGASVPDALT
jgi:hypothetical protein